MKHQPQRAAAVTQTAASNLMLDGDSTLKSAVNGIGDGDKEIEDKLLDEGTTNRSETPQGPGKDIGLD